VKFEIIQSQTLLRRAEWSAEVQPDCGDIGQSQPAATAQETRQADAHGLKSVLPSETVP
jgi:hypothetical protein